MSGTNGNSIEIAQSEQELVGSKKKFNVKKLAVLAAIVFIVVASIVVAVVLLSEPASESSPQISKSPISLEDILEGRLTSKRFNGSWMSENEIIYRDIEGIVWSFDVTTKTSKILLGVENEQLAQGIKFDVSADNKFLLVAREHQKIFRHSFAAKYDVVNLLTSEVYPIRVQGKYDHLVLAEWGPVGNSIIIVYMNNIYFKPKALDEAIPLTFDGGSSIYNGVPDWVYEEEVFSSNSALWVSKDGNKLAYVQFNDTSTNLMSIQYFGQPGSLEYQYPKGVAIHYPKSGSPNPTVKLFEISLEKLKENQLTKFEILVPKELQNKEHLITSVSWATNNNLLSTWMNRVQNHGILQGCENEICNNIKEFKSTTGWLEFFGQPIYNGDGTQMALIISQQQGDAGGFRHLTLISVQNGEITPLTRGKYVVQDIVRWDEKTNFIFYMSNTETESKVLHLYAIKAEPGSDPKCLTCDLTFCEGNNSFKQSYFEVEFPKTGNYFVLSALGPNIPRCDIFMWEVKNNSVSISPVIEWETNPDLHEIIKDKETPMIIHETISLSSNFTSKVILFVPPNADLTGAVKYPMLVDVYGGPDSYYVVDKWSMDWGSFLVSNRSIIYAKIDGRGSGLRGDKLMHTIYKKFGTVEIEDQIETTRKLQEKLPYIDMVHTGIWGWSYGGYASAMALAQDDNQVFRCAASVAPVTDWVYYDSIYTERYMGLPTNDDNLEGYKTARLSTIPKKFEGKSLFLIHGSFDDNVHYQQSMALSRSLEKSDILFKQLTYPDEDHGLAGVRPHLYHSLGRFFGECFEKGDL